MKAGWTDRWVDRLNPILLKEVRQLVRSRFVAVMLMLLLGALLFVGGCGLVVEEIGSTVSDETFAAGQQLFGGFMAVLALSTIIFVPAYAGIRFASERGSGNADLLFVSTLKPVNIVWGKLLGVMVIAGLLFGACMPFMAFTYMLRGIDLLMVFSSLLGLLVLVILLAQAALFLAAIPVNRVFRVIITVFSILGVLVGAGVFASVGVARVMTGGRAMASASSWEYWAAQLTVLSVYLAGIGLFFFMTVALIAPARSNRSMPVRVFFTVVWAAMLIPSYLWGRFAASDEAVLVWMGVSVSVICLATAIVASERDRISDRVRRAIPRNVLVRSIVFPFFTGPVNGLAWCVVMIAVSTAIGFASESARGGSDIEVVYTMLAIAVYFLCYTLTAVLLRRLFFKRLLTESYTWALTGVVLAASCLVPTIIGFLAGESVVKSGSIWRLGNFVFSGADDEHARHLVFGGVWLLAVLIANAGWVWRHLRDFRPLPAAPPPPDENEQQAVAA